jgi:transposase
MKTEAQIRHQFQLLLGVLDERGRRRWAATEAQTLGRGGISRVSRATGISRPTIHLGLRELGTKRELPLGRSRRSGGGRKSLEFHVPDINKRVEALVEPLTRGDPESPLRWTIKSTRQLADELARQGCSISHMSVSDVLHDIGYSLQGNRKTQEGKQHPDRNAQFEHINKRATAEIAARNPVISVDTKKKELVGNYKNHGREWHRKGKAPTVNDHDFPDPSVPRAHPYGVYDLARNTGWVNVGTDRC